MCVFVSAFPKSLHCTDEAQQAETVLSVVLSITLLLRAGELPVFPRQRYRVVQWLQCHLRGQMYPTVGSLQPQFVEHSTWDALSLAIGQSSLRRWFEHSGMEWCFLALKLGAPGRA